MAKEDLYTFYKRAIKKAKARGYSPQLSEDFGCWLIVRIIEGIGHNQFLGQALTDYLREQNGSDRYQTKRPVFIEWAEDLNPTEKPLSPEDRVIAWDLIKKTLNPMEEKIFYLYFREGHTCKEIGESFGVSEAYIFHRVRNILNRIKNPDRLHRMYPIKKREGSSGMEEN